MNDYKIVGLSKPNKVKLSSKLKDKIIEMPLRITRKLHEEGVIRIQNPDTLYVNI